MVDARQMFRNTECPAGTVDPPDAWCDFCAADTTSSSGPVPNPTTHQLASPITFAPVSFRRPASPTGTASSGPAHSYSSPVPNSFATAGPAGTTTTEPSSSSSSNAAPQKQHDQRPSPAPTAPSITGNARSQSPPRKIGAAAPSSLLHCTVQILAMIATMSVATAATALLRCGRNIRWNYWNAILCTVIEYRCAVLEAYTCLDDFTVAKTTSFLHDAPLFH
jgi:hypothetical protein